MRTGVVLVVAFMAIVPAPAAAGETGTRDTSPSTRELERLLSDEDAGRVTFAVYQLAARGKVPEARTKALCTHKDPYVRRAAVFALGTMGDAANKGLFSKAARDADAGVRRAAVFALANLGGEEAVALIERAVADPHPAVRELAATALGRLGGRRAVRLLIGMLDDPSRRVRRAAVVSLGGLGDTSALGPLRTLRDEPERGINTRSAAVTEANLDAGHNFGYEFMTLPAFMARFSAQTGIPTFVTDEALAAVAIAARDPDNLDGLKVSMWHVKARTFLDELTRAAGLAWVIEGRWVIVTPAAYLAYDTPLELEIAGALYRLGDASAEATLKRYLKLPQWKARAKTLMGQR